MSQTQEENEQACNQPISTIRKKARRLLLVIEYQHTLYSKNPSQKTFFGRPYSDILNEYLDQHFDVVLWSTCVGSMSIGVSKLFPKAKLVWGADKMLEAATLYNSRKSCKNLELVWKELDHDITDTIYLTHTDEVNLPPTDNVVAISPYDTKCFTWDHALLKLIKYLEKIRFEPNVVEYIKQRPFNESYDWEIITNPAIDRHQTRYDRNGNIMENLPGPSPEKRRMLEEKMRKEREEKEEMMKRKREKEEKEERIKREREEKMKRKKEKAERIKREREEKERNRLETEKDKTPDKNEISKSKEKKMRLEEKIQKEEEEWIRKVEEDLTEQEMIRMKEQERIWMERVMEIEEAGQRAHALASTNKSSENKRIRDPSPIEDVKRTKNSCSQLNDELRAQVEEFIASVSADIAAWDSLNKKK